MNTPPTAKIAAATASLIEAMRQASLKKETLKTAKAAFKQAEKSLKQARKASRKTTKLVCRAKDKLAKQQRKAGKAKPTKTRETPPSSPAAESPDSSNEFHSA
ncbi:MAG: hypothetical protein ABIS50_06665 [Luteolibacter sp.]|uniref:hypothetical protein n=1 Tax=Luteolibacter sp. TaxID=1962973 RepID=UPI00326326F5